MHFPARRQPQVDCPRKEGKARHPPRAPAPNAHTSFRPPLPPWGSPRPHQHQGWAQPSHISRPLALPSAGLTPFVALVGPGAFILRCAQPGLWTRRAASCGAAEAMQTPINRVTASNGRRAHVGTGEADRFGPERSARKFGVFGAFALGCALMFASKDIRRPSAALCSKASERIALLKKQKEREELQECTFKPKVSTEGRSVARWVQKSALLASP